MGKRYILSGIKSWPKEERPREKLFNSGEHSLSSVELIAILLGSGTKGESAIDLSRKIFHEFGSFRKMCHTDINQWKQFRGLGRAKIAQIKAALEIGKRCSEEKERRKRLRIESSKDAADILIPRMRDLKKEVFKPLFLNSDNAIIEIVEVEEGTVNQAFPIIREIFQKAIQYFAASIICLHNHPSGNKYPSPEDKEFTRKLVEAGNILQIKALDHIVIANDSYFSFLDEGLI